MTTRKETFSTDEYYHVYNRGNSKQKIFIDANDYERFAKLLYICNSSKSINFRDDIIIPKIDAFDFDRGPSIISIGAWVLMPNHFHILLSPRGTLGDNIGMFMNKLTTSYSMYFNKKYGRTGKLFEGTFKSVHAMEDSQLKYNFSYIHLNPIKLINPHWRENGINNMKNTLAFLEKYKWSSYNDYRDFDRKEIKIISKKDFPDYFEDKKVFEKEIFEWLSFDDE